MYKSEWEVDNTYAWSIIAQKLRRINFFPLKIDLVANHKIYIILSGKWCSIDSWKLGVRETIEGKVTSL